MKSIRDDMEAGRVNKTLTVIAAVALMAPAAATAQKCEVNESKPFQVNSARIYVNKALDAKGKDDEKKGHLANAVQVLTDQGDKIGNPAGRAMLLGKALFLWTYRPGIGYTSTRGTLGYTDRKNEPVDLLVGIDSAFTVVETMVPACADSLMKLRRMIGVKLINDAIQQLNANAPDSAAALTHRAAIIMPRSPYVYNTFAVISERRAQTDSLVYYYSKVLETVGDDTAFARMKGQAQYNLAVAKLNASDNAPPAEKKQMLSEAKTLLEAYLAANPGNAAAQRALARAAVATGDTAAAKSVHAEMLANPGKYNEVQLYEAASALAIAKSNADAVKLFDAALAQNPYFRDALFNLASTHGQAKDFEQMLAVSKRLVAVDPGNPDNWQQLATAYQGLYRAEKNEVRKKALLDSLVKYTQVQKSAPLRVVITRFSHGGARHTVNGAVENLSATPRDVTLKFEFLDKAGTVVTTSEVNLGSLAPKTSKPFTTSVDQPGIVAFRYAPLY